MRPQITVLDEPTSQLDPIGSDEVFEVIRRLHNQGYTIILAEHKVEALAELATRILVLSEGKLVLDGSPRKVFGNPQLQEYRVLPPRYALLGRTLAERSLRPAGNDPLTIDEAASMLRQVAPHAMLECRDLVFSYPHSGPALAGVNWSVEPGEAVAIVGRNGSGKTTLAKHLNGLLAPQAGSVWVDGQAVAGREPAELAPLVGLVFQNPSDQIFQSRVDEEVSFGLRQLGLRGDVLAERVRAALADTSLEWAASLHPYDLTLTERKLVCLASVLAMKPKVVVLDEPTTAQDQFGVNRLIEIVRRIRGQGQTVVTITHDMDFVAEAFERTVVMREGQIVLDSPTPQVFARQAVLATTYVKPSAMSRLAQQVGLPADLMTVDRLANWVQKAVSVNGQ
jgi:energy-coupling factor transport system ATP-binding protein